MESRARLKRWMTLVGVAGVVAGIPVGIALNQWLREPLIEDSLWLHDFSVTHAGDYTPNTISIKPSKQSPAQGL